MATTVSATDTPAKLIISQTGAPGDTGDTGANGSGLNNVRKSLIENPLFHGFKKNELSSVSAPTNTDSDIAWNRASTGAYVDIYGVVQTAAIDTPRQEAEGWLIEGASTNNLIWSEDLTNAAWNKFDVTISSNVSIAPNGDTTLDRIVENTNNAQHVVTQVIPNDSTVPSSVSVFVSSAGRSSLFFRLDDGASVNIISCHVDLSGSGQVGAVSNSGSATDGSATITKVGNFFRVTMSGNLNSISGTATVRLYLTQSFNGPLTYLGDGASGINLWGAMLEELGGASSYIPTLASAATRSADINTFATYNNIPSTEFSELTICMTVNLIPNLIHAIISIGETDNVAGRLQVNSAGAIFVTGNNVQSRITNDGEVEFLTDSFICVTYDGVNMQAYINGVASSVGAVPVTFIQDITLNSCIGYRASVPASIPSYGAFRDIRLYDFPLNSDEIKYLNGV